MRTALISLYHSSLPPSKPPPKPIALHIIFLPLPIQSTPPLDQTLQTLISTYLLHSLTIPLVSKIPPKLADYTSSLLSEPTLLSWLPHIRCLSPKHLDSVLTRAYTALTKSSTAYSQAHPQLVLSIRAYALRCLLHTTPGTMEPNTFWDQTTKFGAAFIKSLASPSTKQDDVTRTVLATFSDLVKEAKNREDAATFLKGRGFLGFCEFWMGFAKKVCTLFTAIDSMNDRFFRSEKSLCWIKLGN
jgi:separase